MRSKITYLAHSLAFWRSPPLAMSSLARYHWETDASMHVMHGGAPPRQMIVGKEVRIGGQGSREEERAANSSYFAPLHRCAPLSPGFRGAPLASATPAPLSVLLDVLSAAARTLRPPARRTCFLRAIAARTLLDGVPSVRVRPVGWPKC